MSLGSVFHSLLRVKSGNGPLASRQTAVDGDRIDRAVILLEHVVAAANPARGVQILDGIAVGIQHAELSVLLEAVQRIQRIHLRLNGIERLALLKGHNRRSEAIRRRGLLALVVEIDAFLQLGGIHIQGGGKLGNRVALDDPTLVHQNARPIVKRHVLAVRGREREIRADDRIDNSVFLIQHYVALVIVAAHQSRSNSRPMRPLDWRSLTREALKWVGSISVRNPVLGKVLNMLDSESDEFIIYQNLQELETNTTAKIIQASSEEEAKKLYDEMIATADQLGGQTVNDWANQLYPQMLAEYEAVRYVGEEGWQK